MVMFNFREMPFVWVLSVALVVLFVFGAGGAVAKVEKLNGHEGDPEDGLEAIGGGSGGGFVLTDKPTSNGLVKIPLFMSIVWVVQQDGDLAPIFIIVPSDNNSLNFEVCSSSKFAVGIK